MTNDDVIDLYDRVKVGAKSSFCATQSVHARVD